MVAVNDFKTPSFFKSASYSKMTVTSMSFSAMFASGMGGNSGDMDVMEQLYNKLTGENGASGALSLLGGKEGLTPFALLLASGKIDATRVFNRNSTGDHILTAEELAMLREKYDVTNLSDQEQYDLMCELSQLNVLTQDEAMSIGRAVMIKVGIVEVSVATVSVWSGELGYRHCSNNLLEQMMAAVRREREDFSFMQDLCNATEEGDANYLACRRFSMRREEIEISISRHEKVSGVLSQLVRDNTAV